MDRDYLKLVTLADAVMEFERAEGLSIEETEIKISIKDKYKSKNKKLAYKLLKGGRDVSDISASVTEDFRNLEAEAAAQEDDFDWKPVIERAREDFLATVHQEARKSPLRRHATRWFPPTFFKLVIVLAAIAVISALLRGGN